MLPIFAIKLGGGAWSSSIGMNFFAVGLVVGLVVGLRVVGLELGRFVVQKYDILVVLESDNLFTMDFFSHHFARDC